MNSDAKRKPLYAKIQDYVADRIRRGEWKRGDRLPSENELAERFGVSRITAKLAMSALAKEGLIYRVQGRGSFVSPEFEDEPNIDDTPMPSASAPRWVAFLVPNLNSSYIVHLLNGIEGTLADAGYRLMVCRTSGSLELERRLIREMVSSGARGIIVYPTEGEAYNEDILRLTLNQYPVVVIDRYLKGLETNCVCSDHFEGARTATAHLLQLGHRNIAYLSTPVAGTSSLEDRLEGYKQALADAGQPMERRWIVTDVENDSLLRFFREHKDVTAVFAANAGIGVRAMDAIEAAGRRIPDEVSVMFFDTYEHASHARIPPTCIVQQEEELGRQAAELLLSVVREPNRERRKIVLPTTLVAGRSTRAAHPQSHGEQG